MCYRADCKEECDEFKKMYCIMRITKDQQEVIGRIYNSCVICGRRTVKAKHKGIHINLCTKCGVLNKAI